MALDQSSTSDSLRHRLLRRQLRRTFGDEITAEGQWAALFEAISNAYHEMDRDRRLLENALDLSAQELDETNGKLRLIIDSAPVGILMLDRDARCLFVSRRWLQELRLSLEDAIGRSLYEVYPQARRWQAIHQRCLGGAIERCEEEAIEWLDGSVRWVRWEVHPWYDGDGAVGGVIVVSEDISERKRAEEQLRIAAVAFQSREGMVVTDTAGVILQVNRAWSAVTGFDSSEAVGKKPSLLRSNRHEVAFYRNMWEAITREGHWEGEVWNRRKDGAVYPVWLSISGVRNAVGELTHYLGTYSNICDPREAERKILELAFYDPLTGLPNRRLLLDRLNQARTCSGRNGQMGAVLLLDLDHFKTLNDTRGHDVGDELLVLVAKRLRETLRETDSAARLGGDEFVVLLEGLHSDSITAATIAETIAEKLRTAISQPVMLKGEIRHITPSIGVALFCGCKESAEILLKQADLALYQAKDAGRNTSRFYNPAMQAAVDMRAELEAGLRRALSKGEFVLHYQPQVDTAGRLIGAEALMRWQPPGKAVVSPRAFIPAAENSGLIVPIGAWLLETACLRLADWAKAEATQNLSLAINISARQFREPGFVKQVESALSHSGARPDLLKLELTESLLLDDVDTVINTMRTLKALGVGFSIDDFGTGYSSLAYLKRLPLDQIKIDQSFVRDIVGDSDNRAIVRAIISLAKSLSLEVIAEGVENEAQRDFLAEHGCHAYQGYLFGRPVPTEQFEALIHRYPTRQADASPAM